MAEIKHGFEQVEKIAIAFGIILGSLVLFIVAKFAIPRILKLLRTDNPTTTPPSARVVSRPIFNPDGDFELQTISNENYKASCEE